MYPEFREGWDPEDHNQQVNDVSKSSSFFHIPCLHVAVPSNVVAVIVRDASSQRDSSQRTSALFTSSKGVMFSSVVLSLRWNLFFPKISY